MLKDITLGQYYQADSVLHRLDPRTKIVGTLIYMVSLFVFNNLICYMFAGIFLLTVIALSKIPVKFMMRGMRSVIFPMLFTMIYNIFLGKGTVIAELGIFAITYEGIHMAVCMFIRLLFLVMGSAVLTLTTTPSRLTDGLESLLKPLKLFRVPVHEIAMMMSIALRFIPILMEEADRIMKAQKARGADFEAKNPIKRVKSLIPVLVPLFVSAFRRAGDLALAMEARCYHGGDGRTRMKVMKYKAADIVSFVIFLMYLGAVISTGILFRDLLPFVIGILAQRFTAFSF
ncbi:MAG: energy-coupling factor transporter transmembrane protein EcfT [Lachnospiraceae bacterium]|nr:energy-coupling factor transporter transmembrane protein EcfT [Lachnospiraceae bacterium]